MFSLFRKKDVKELFPLANGKMIDITEVPDKVFSSKMMGDGLAFQYEGDTIYAPCDAQVMMIANTKHAIGLKTANDIEILIHIGMDTVELRGKGFDVLVKKGEQVRRGQALAHIDRKLMEEHHLNLTTPLVITSNHQIEKIQKQMVDLDTAVIRIT